MNVVDLVLIVALVLFALIGWRTGFVQGALSFAGFFGFGLVAAQLVPGMVASWQVSNPWRLLLTLGLVLLIAGVGQALGSWLGSRLKGTLSWEPAQWVDRLLGAALAVFGVLLTIWLVTTAILAVPAMAVAGPLKESALLRGLNSSMPAAAKDAVANMQTIIDNSGLPKVVDGFYIAPEGQKAPDEAEAKTPGVRSVLASVVKVSGNKPACGSGATGSGYVSTPEHVTTNAHVVAAMENPQVETDGGETYPAQVVAFDPGVDVAVLYVPGLQLEPVPTLAGAQDGESAAVAGYPGGGPLKVSGARIRTVIDGRDAAGTDIYGRPGVQRQVFVLSAQVRPGNSGGPLLSSDGRVLGLVFAQAKEDGGVGFALTAEQFRVTSRQAGAATQPVDTGPCPVR